MKHVRLIILSVFLLIGGIMQASALTSEEEMTAYCSQGNNTTSCLAAKDKYYNEEKNKRCDMNSGYQDDEKCKRFTKLYYENSVNLHCNDANSGYQDDSKCRAAREYLGTYTETPEKEENPYAKDNSYPGDNYTSTCAYTNNSSKITCIANHTTKTVECSVSNASDEYSISSSFNANSKPSWKMFTNNGSNACASSISVRYKISNGVKNLEGVENPTPNASMNSITYLMYSLAENNIKNEEIKLNEGEAISQDDLPDNFFKTYNTGEFCNNTIGVFTALGWILMVVKVVLPLIVIAMASRDVFKAIISSKDDELKQSIKTLAVRVVLGVVIFFVPTLVEFIIGVIGEDDIYKGTSFGKCTECILNPSEKVCKNIVD